MPQMNPPCMLRTLLFLLLVLPALASPLTDYLQLADNIFRQSGLYRRQFVACLDGERKFGNVLGAAGGYNTSLKNLLARLESAKTPGEAKNYHDSLLALMRKQVEHSASIEFQVSNLTQLEGMQARNPSQIVEADYKRQIVDFFQFLSSIDSLEKPLLDRVLELRQQLKPDFVAEPAPEKPGPHRRP